MTEMPLRRVFNKVSASVNIKKKHVYAVIFSVNKNLWQKSEFVMVIRLRYLKDSNVAEHFVNTDICYTVIYLSVRSKTYINLYFLK